MITVTINGEKIQAESNCLLSACVTAHGHLDTPCGGKGRCGKCRVYASGALSPLTQEEQALLTEEERKNGMRLACCCRALGSCEIRTTKEGKAHVLGLQSSRIRMGRPVFREYGAAIDIGTTTLAAVLYDRSGKPIADQGQMNPQSPWGADVISRIDAALKGHAPDLSRCVQKGLNDLLQAMSRTAGIPPEQIDGVVITGNTAMLYLLTQSNPDCLSHAPFLADRLFGEWLRGKDLELCCPEARVYLPRCFSAFVGADTNTALLYCGLTERTDSCLMADIGTNGEIALWDSGSLLCCSTAAGPAFEGAGLSMGMPGKDGAIDHVTVENGAYRAHVLGDQQPAGICGSGVIDAMACMLETEDMDETGYLEDGAVAIAGQVSVSQKDVRTMQLAKSAVCAGIRTLMDSAEAAPDSVAELAIAGGFGSYLRRESAGRIGLIPQEMVGRVRVLGNAALGGAAMILLDQSNIERSQHLADCAKTVDLSTNARFMQYYTDGMYFEE